MHDLVIRNGKVVNLRKNTLDNIDIGIKKGKIVTLGKNIAIGESEIDAKGKIVSPGFIDIHMHEEKLFNSEYDNEYDISNKMLEMGVTSCVGGNCGNNREDLRVFVDHINENGAPVNYMMFIGHNFLRDKVGIKDRYREASQEEIRKMNYHLNEYLEYGAIGVSFGLEYSPGVSSTEIYGLLNNPNKDILLSAHYRSDGEASYDAIREMIDISRKTGFPMEISHLGSCSAMGHMEKGLRLIEDAIREGIDVSADIYPYDAFSTYIGSAVFDEGCFDRWEKSYDSILLTEGLYRGVRCNKEVFERIRKEKPEMLVVAFVMNEEEVIEGMKSPFVYIGSDGVFNRGQGHPRGAGTFPRVLGKYSIREKNLALFDAIRKMTLGPALRLGITEKGEIEIGKDGDLVIFDPENIIDNASFENPNLSPSGIEYVIIDGKVAKDGNGIVNDRLGRIIRG